VLDRSAAAEDLVLAARLSELQSGCMLEISTNQPGIQFYNGSFQNGSVTGRESRSYGPRAGLCLEPQNFPDAPNHAHFPKSRLEPCEVYTNRVVEKLARVQPGACTTRRGWHLFCHNLPQHVAKTWYNLLVRLFALNARESSIHGGSQGI
jgi:hypothetical protein